MILDFIFSLSKSVYFSSLLLNNRLQYICSSPAATPSLAQYTNLISSNYILAIFIFSYLKFVIEITLLFILSSEKIYDYSGLLLFFPLDCFHSFKRLKGLSAKYLERFLCLLSHFPFIL